MWLIVQRDFSIRCEEMSFGMLSSHLLAILLMWTKLSGLDDRLQ